MWVECRETTRGNAVPRSNSSKVHINIPRPVRQENCYQNQREEFAEEDCLIKAVAVVEGCRQRKEDQGKGGQRITNPTLLLPSS